MDVVYDEPNDETIAALEEVRSGKPLEKLDSSKIDSVALLLSSHSLDP